MLVACEKEVRGSGEIGAGDSARGRRFAGRTVCSGKASQRYFRGGATGTATEAVGTGAGGTTRKLLIWKEQLLPKHPMAEAVNYTLSQWEELNVFTSDGAVPIDNNVSEREMKRVVLNRKNSLFVGNPRGGRTAAILASLTSSCRRHDLDPQLYFMQLLVNLSSWPASDLDAWLPDRWKQAHAARCAALGIPPPPAT